MAQRGKKEKTCPTSCTRPNLDLSCGEHPLETIPDAYLTINSCTRSVEVPHACLHSEPNGAGMPEGVLSHSATVLNITLDRDIIVLADPASLLSTCSTTI